MNIYAKIDGKLKQWNADDQEDIQNVLEASIEILRARGKTATVLVVVPKNHRASK